MAGEQFETPNLGWHGIYGDRCLEALMFPTFGRAERKGRKCLAAESLLKWRIYSIADKLNISRKLVTFQVMR